MHPSCLLLLVVATSSTAQGFNVATETDPAVRYGKRSVGNIKDWLTNFFNKKGNSGDAATCPPVWSEISTDLTAQFLADGQCTDAARAAIRASFHDCFNGACDGSLILTEECSRPENRGLERLCDALKGVAQEHPVGMADLIQFAAAHAIKTCPGGPTVPVKVGRTDSSEASPAGGLPPHNAGGGDLVRKFGEKGFSPIDLAALIGAHTAARQRFVDPGHAGAALDSTVGEWDNKFYRETMTGQAPFTLEADKNIATNPATTIPFNSFALSKGAWDAAFVSAMTKMSMMGVEDKDMIDCTSALPGGSRKREIKRSNIFDRLKW